MKLFFSIGISFGLILSGLAYAEDAATPLAVLADKMDAETLQTQIQALLEQIDNLEKQLKVLDKKPNEMTKVIPEITRNFSLGNRDATTNNEITAWQDFLVSERKGPDARRLEDAFNSGVKKGYFGVLTGEATIEWQRAHDVLPTFPGVGPKTRNALAKRIDMIIFPIDENKDGVFLTSPHGGEIWTVGGEYTVTWEYNPTTSSVSAPKFILISLVDGPKNGLVIAARELNILNNSTTFKLNAIIQGDIAVTPEAGKYNVKVQFYDREFCIGLCPTPAISTPKPVLLGEDISDEMIIIHTKPNISSIQSIKTKNFAVALPKEWKFNQLQGIDSDVGEFVGDGMKLSFDFGWYSNSLALDNDPNYDITYEVIGGKKAKLVIPKLGTKGATGIYFGDLGNKNRLSIVTTNLTIEQQVVALEIFRSITF